MARRATQNEVERERTKLEELQRKLEQRLLEVDGEVQCQRDQISAEFDELSRQREHEHQLKVSELNSQLLSRESQVKQLEREVRMAQTARASSDEQAKGKESEVTRMEREMRELQWKMEDASNCLESRVAELQSQLEQTQAVARSHQEDFQRRWAIIVYETLYVPSPLTHQWDSFIGSSVRHCCIHNLHVLHNVMKHIVYVIHVPCLEAGSRPPLCFTYYIQCHVCNQKEGKTPREATTCST